MCAALCDLPLAGVRVRDDAAAFHPAGNLQNGGFGVCSSPGRSGARQKPRDLCPVVPTQRGPWGIRYDFNCGCRIQLPKGGTYHVTITDAWTGTVFADGEYEGGSRIYTTKKYYVSYIVDIRNNQTGEAWQHVMQLKGRPVAVHILVSTIGDVMAWFPYGQRLGMAGMGMRRARCDDRRLFLSVDRVSRRLSRGEPAFLQRMLERYAL